MNYDKWFDAVAWGNTIDIREWRHQGGDCGESWRPSSVGLVQADDDYDNFVNCEIIDDLMLVLTNAEGYEKEIWNLLNR